MKINLIFVTDDSAQRYYIILDSVLILDVNQSELLTAKSEANNLAKGLDCCVAYVYVSKDIGHYQTSGVGFKNTDIAPDSLVYDLCYEGFGCNGAISGCETIEAMNLESAITLLDTTTLSRGEHISSITNHQHSSQNRLPLIYKKPNEVRLIPVPGNSCFVTVGNVCVCIKQDYKGLSIELHSESTMRRGDIVAPLNKLHALFEDFCDDFDF